MTVRTRERALHKEPVLEAVDVSGSSALEKYRGFVVGRPGLGALIRYEIAAVMLASFPGAAGYWLRKTFYRGLMRSVGRGAVWGRDIALRHPGRISIGSGVAIDDRCLLDARGGGDQGIVIGDDVLIARDTIIQAKASPIEIGDRCVIGSQCQLSSSGGIRLGRAVMVGGHTYIGGGRYRTDRRDIPMMDQQLYSIGPVVIEDDVWIGAGAVILDGVRIGTGAVIGAGAVIREEVQPFSVVTPYQKLVVLPRTTDQ
jgi:acetyltransferase-like isoleucine patch superfamily enzyme